MIPPGPINVPAKVDGVATPFYEISPTSPAPETTTVVGELPATGPALYAPALGALGVVAVMFGAMAVRVARR